MVLSILEKFNQKASVIVGPDVSSEIAYLAVIGLPLRGRIEDGPDSPLPEIGEIHQVSVLRRSRGR